MPTTPFVASNLSLPAPVQPGTAMPPEGAAMPIEFDQLPTPILECDAQGMIVAANLEARNLVHVHGLNFLGREIWSLAAPDERQLSRSLFFAAMADPANEPPSVRRDLYTSGGGFRTYHMTRCLVRAADGHPTGMRLVLSDVTEHAAAHAEERTSRLWLESISDALAEAVIVTDVLGFIRFANPAAVHLTEWDSAELLRTTISKAVPILSYSRADAVPFNYRLVLERRSSGIITFLTRNKQQATVAFSTSPVLDAKHGSTVGVCYVFRKPDMQV